MRRHWLTTPVDDFRFDLFPVAHSLWFAKLQLSHYSRAAVLLQAWMSVSIWQAADNALMDPRSH
jgi:hypothetical protein